MDLEDFFNQVHQKSKVQNQQEIVQKNKKSIQLGNHQYQYLHQQEIPQQIQMPQPIYTPQQKQVSQNNKYYLHFNS